jgi:polyisoprenoid-binding protein YceI
MLSARRGNWIVTTLFAAQAVASGANGVIALDIDPHASHVVISVGKAGMLAFAGHNHEVLAPAVLGTVTFDPADWQHSSVTLEFETAALRVTGAGDPPADVPKVQEVMASDQVLDVKRFPSVTFCSRRVLVAQRTGETAEVSIEGDLTLHGVTRPTTVRANVSVGPSGTLIARGTFPIKQTDFDMVPVTAAGGTIRTKDAVDVQFVFEAHRR